LPPRIDANDKRSPAATADVALHGSRKPSRRALIASGWSTLMIEFVGGGIRGAAKHTAAGWSRSRCIADQAGRNDPPLRNGAHSGRSSNIARVYCVGEDYGLNFIVFEFIGD
jgi:hypothetical protein